MPGQFIPPDHSRGDPNTIGGYMAVHGRPAAFEGSDGISYSVSIEADQHEPSGSRAWGAYFLFLRWRRIGPQGVEGHLESDMLAFGDTGGEARAKLGAMLLGDVRSVLEALIATHRVPGERRWYDVMRDEGNDE